MKDKSLLKDFLEAKHDAYNRESFVERDPVCIPHRFSKKEDIEISGFLASTIAWGQRPVIVSNMLKLIGTMDNAPFDFVINHTAEDLKPLKKFVHRTFNGVDCIFFIESLHNIYKNCGGMENVFREGINSKSNNLTNAMHYFRKTFFSIPHLSRTTKHVADPLKNSSSKRLCMFLRWMVRNDNRGVDFGIWNISSRLLSCPLDLHTARVSRKLGLLNRKQNDWKAVTELTGNLKEFDADDPVKYDFALFGLGIFEKF